MTAFGDSDLMLLLLAPDPTGSVRATAVATHAEIARRTIPGSGSPGWGKMLTTLTLSRPARRDLTAALDDVTRTGLPAVRVVHPRLAPRPAVVALPDLAAWAAAWHLTRRRDRAGLRRVATVCEQIVALEPAGRDRTAAGALIAGEGDWWHAVTLTDTLARVVGGGP